MVKDCNEYKSKLIFYKMKLKPISGFSMFVILLVVNAIFLFPTVSAKAKPKTKPIVLARDSASAHASLSEMQLGFFAHYSFPG